MKGPVPRTFSQSRRQDFACTVELRRAVLIGLRPDGQSDHDEPFELLRALSIHELSRHGDRLRGRADVMGLDPSGGDLHAGARAVYSSIRRAFQRALAGELRRCVDIERRLRARGRSPGRGPVQKWKGVWVDPGFCELRGDHSCTQTLLPELPPALPSESP